MNKIALILSMVSLSFSTETMPLGKETVHDNFKPAGLQIDGSGRFSTMWRSAELNGKCGIFIWDGFQFSTTVGIGTSKYWTTRKYKYQIYSNGKFYNIDTTYQLTEKSSSLTTNINAAYFWGYKRGKTDRLVHSVGMGIRFGFSKLTPIDFVKQSEQEIPSDIQMISRDIFFQPGNPYYQLFWFITPTIAPNAKIEYELRSRAVPDLTLGFSYFIPSKKLVLIHLEKKAKRQAKQERRINDGSTDTLSDSTEIDRVI